MYNRSAVIVPINIFHAHFCTRPRAAVPFDLFWVVRRRLRQLHNIRTASPTFFPPISCAHCWKTSVVDLHSHCLLYTSIPDYATDFISKCRCKILLKTVVLAPYV